MVVRMYIQLEEIFEQYPIGSQNGLGGKTKVIAKFLIQQELEHVNNRS